MMKTIRKNSKISNSPLRVQLILVLLISLATPSLAQTNNGRIEGIIIDNATEEPLEGATIFIEELQKGEITGKGGAFYLNNLPLGTYTLTIQYIGYQTKTIKLTLSGIKPQKEIIRLEREVLSLNEVVVMRKSKARKLREQAMPVTVYDMKQLQGTVNNLEDILSKTIGVTIRSQGAIGSASRLSLRGLEGKRVGFFIDESPINENSDFLNINDIPIDMIERIEIYKGVVPAKLGGSGVGGAINIVLKEYPPRYMDVSYSFGSFNTHKFNSTLKQNFAQQGIEIGGALYYTHSDNNYKMELPLEKGKVIRRDHDRYNQLGGGIQMKARRWWFDEVELEVEGIKSNKEIQGIVENIREAHSKGYSFQTGLDLKKKDFFLEGLDLNSSTGYGYSVYRYCDTAKVRYDWDMNPYPTQSIYGGEVGMYPSFLTMRKNSFGNKTNIDYLFNEQHTLSLNSLFKMAFGSPSNSFLEKAVEKKLNYDSKMASLVMGLGYEYKSPRDIFLNALTIKYYFYSMKTKIAEVWQPNIEDINIQQHHWGINDAMRYRFTDELLGKLSFGYDVRQPTEEELIGNGFHLVPSGDLRPEHGVNVNLGFLFDKKINSGLLQVEINGFCSYLKDMIRYTRNHMQGKYANFGEMRSVGVEAEVKADLTSWLYSYLNATFQDLRDARKYATMSGVVTNPTKGLRMPNIPYFLTNAGIEIHKGNPFGGRGQNIRVFTDASYVEEYFFDFEVSKLQHKRIPRSLRIDLGTEYSFLNGGIIVSAKVTNLANARLVSEFNYPLPGRAFMFRIRYIMK